MIRHEYEYKYEYGLIEIKKIYLHLIVPLLHINYCSSIM